MIPDFLIPLLVGGVIQFIKLIIDYTMKGVIEWKALWSAGWFPSVHSGMAASITTLMYLHYGHESAAFIIAFCFSFLFWYDAANVRYEAGQHASYLNKLSLELGNILNMQKTTHMLKERLWHTFIEVIWGIGVGVGLTFVYFILSNM